MSTVVKEKDVCDYKKQYPGVNQRTIAEYFSLIWGRTIHQSGDVLEIFSVKMNINERRKRV